MKTLKALILSGILLCFSSCFEPPNENEAKALVESLIQQIDKENYSELSDFYAADFNEGESLQARTEKFQKLRDIMGAVKTIELTDSEMVNEPGVPAKIILTYRIGREKVASIEKFIVFKDEGKYVVANHSITN
jgi:uncharacterized protein VirK/YbjX